MDRMKNLFLAFITIIVLSACGAQKTIQTPNGISQDLPGGTTNTYSAQQIPESTTSAPIPYPIAQTTQPAVNPAYPGSNEGSGSSTASLNQDYYVTQLIVPTPSSGKGVITGQLLSGGDTNQPLLATIYLAPTVPASSPDLPPIVNFSSQSDPIATQEIDTGRFMFTDVTPGQYALVVMIPSESLIIKDSNGNNLIIDGKSNEVTDLGKISLTQ